MDGLGRGHAASLRHGARAQPALHDRLEAGQIRAGVGSDRVVRIVDLQNRRPEPARAGDPDEVGQVVLALRVVVPDGVDQLEQQTSIDAHHAGITESYTSFFICRIGKFDNPFENAVRSDDKSSVAVPRPDMGAEDGGDRARAAAGGDQVAKRPALDHGGVAEHHDRVAVALSFAETGERAARGLHRVGRSQRDRLHGGPRGRDRLGQAVHAGAGHHHGPLRRDGGDGVQHVMNHGPAGDPVHDLRQVGLHADAAPRRQDHRGDARKGEIIGHVDLSEGNRACSEDARIVP